MKNSSSNITCHHCGHEWKSRKEKPKKCPQCQNPLWKSDKPKRKKATQPELEDLVRGETPIEVLGTPLRVPQETVTSTPEVQSDASGADTLPIADGYIAPSVDEQERQMEDVSKYKAKAEELLRRLNAPSD